MGLSRSFCLGPGDDSNDAGRALGASGVDSTNLCVRVWAPDEGRVQHSGEADVRDELGLAGDYSVAFEELLS